MRKGNTENTLSNCNCKTEGLYVIALILIMASLLCFTLILVFNKQELETVNTKSKEENPLNQVKERFRNISKIIARPEESSPDK